MGRNVTVPASYVRQILQMVEEQGLSVRGLLAAVEIDPGDIERNTSFPADKFGQLYRHIYSMAQDEFFGLTSGGKVPNGTFRLMCHCLIHAPTLESAIYRASDFHEICRGTQVKPLLKRQGRYAKLSFTTTEAATASLGEIFAHESPQKIRTTLSMWHHFICWLIGKRVPLKAAYFAFPQPEDAGQYRTLFQSDVRFDQHDNALVFPAVYLNYPVIQTPGSLRSFLKTAPYQLIVMVDNDSGLKAQVVALIGKDFSQELPSAEEVADRLHMSVSTLRRRLMEENTSYQKVKDECRREAALNYMNSPQLSINDVAELMGFTDHSAFFRSFKKWTGQTPGAYRQQQIG
ncbi:AraC family transcriptional regulator [Neptuniibacter sp. CAU 1671]|nr:AraC family transcriptional regulator [Neptuniibacter sp. CAU 1671]MDF2182828.1 AraC family transcriptional regulator [Neptuniibacter sp. CAU 1671]